MERRIAFLETNASSLAIDQRSLAQTRCHVTRKPSLGGAGSSVPSPAIVVGMQRRTVLLLGAALSLSLAACSHNAPAAAGAAEPSSLDARADAEATLKKLTVDAVAARLAANDGHTFVYDENSQESWRQGHVPGARWLDEDAVTAAALPPDKGATLIFYCHDEL